MQEFNDSFTPAQYDPADPEPEQSGFGTIAIVGSREFPDMELVDNITEALCRDYPDAMIISGGARGVDRRAIQKAQRLGSSYEVYDAKWDEYGRRAGAIRNKYVVDHADFIVAFWDGVSPGTKITIDMALREKKPINIYIRSK